MSATLDIGAPVIVAALQLYVLALLFTGISISIGSSFIFPKLSDGSAALKVLLDREVVEDDEVEKLSGALKLCEFMVEAIVVTGSGGIGAVGVILMAPFEFFTKSKRSEAVDLATVVFVLPTLLLLKMEVDMTPGM